MWLVWIGVGLKIVVPGCVCTANSLFWVGLVWVVSSSEGTREGTAGLVCGLVRMGGVGGGIGSITVTELPKFLLTSSHKFLLRQLPS